MNKNKANALYQEAFDLRQKTDLRDKERMVDLLKKSITLDENLIEAKMLLAHTYLYHFKKFNESIKIFRSVIDRLNQKDNLLYINCQNGLGLAHSFKGNASDSIQDYHSSISYLNATYNFLKSQQNASKPYLIQCLDWLGVSYQGAGDFDSAKKTLEISLSVHNELKRDRKPLKKEKIENSKNKTSGKLDKGNNAFTKYVIGNCYDKAGNFRKTIKVLNEVKSQYEEQNNIVWLKNTLCALGGAYYKKNMYNKCIQHINAFNNHSKIETDFHTESLALLYYMLSTIKNGEHINEKEISDYIKRCKKDLTNGTYEYYFFLFELTSKNQFLRTSYNKVQEIVEQLEKSKKNIFSKYPIPLKIIKAYNKGLD